MLREEWIDTPFPMHFMDYVSIVPLAFFLVWACS